MARITIPYAVADFIDLRERGYYYVDKTEYIFRLEDYKAPIFLRPRRFGKSLLVSTLACYYDRTKANRFDELFGGTWIGNHPTKEHNRYMIIRYDFSKMVANNHITVMLFCRMVTYPGSPKQFFKPMRFCTVIIAS